MANASLDTLTYNVKLENGTDEAGKIKTVNVGMGNMAEDTQNDDKLLAVVSALAPCLSKTIAWVSKTEISTITA